MYKITDVQVYKLLTQIHNTEGTFMYITEEHHVHMNINLLILGTFQVLSLKHSRYCAIPAATFLHSILNTISNCAYFYTLKQHP